MGVDYFLIMHYSYIGIYELDTDFLLVYGCSKLFVSDVFWAFGYGLYAAGKEEMVCVKCSTYVSGFWRIFGSCGNRVFCAAGNLYFEKGDLRDKRLGLYSVWCDICRGTDQCSCAGELSQAGAYRQ